MLQLFNVSWVKGYESYGVALIIHWPLNQFAFGYAAGTELNIGSISSFTGHLFLSIFEVRLVKVSVDAKSATLTRDLDQVMKRLGEDD